MPRTRSILSSKPHQSPSDQPPPLTRLIKSQQFEPLHSGTMVDWNSLESLNVQAGMEDELCQSLYCELTSTSVFRCVAETGPYTLRSIFVTPLPLLSFQNSADRHTHCAAGSSPPLWTLSGPLFRAGKSSTGQWSVTRQPFPRQR